MAAAAIPRPTVVLVACASREISRLPVTPPICSANEATDTMVLRRAAGTRACISRCRSGQPPALAR